MGLAVLRHYVENRLASFALAISTRDTGSLASLIKSVRVSLVDHGLQEQPLQVSGIMGLLPPSERCVLMTTSNLSVFRSDASVRYTATNQLWETRTDRYHPPSFGLFQGAFRSGPQVWRWTEHTIHPVGS